MNFEQNTGGEPRGRIDWLILLPVVGLMFFGLAFVYSASAPVADMRFGSREQLFFNHAFRVFIGLVAIIIFAKIDYRVWRKLSKILLTIAIIMLVLVLIIGSQTKGAARWINLGFVSFQPSELAKFALIMHIATLLDKKKDHIKDFKKTFRPLLIWVGLVCVLIAAQPNFSTAMVIYLIAVCLMFIGNANLLHVLTTTSIGLLAGGIYTITAEYRMKRALAYIGSIFDMSSVEIENYQLNQALLALGNGGLFGVGPGQNRQSHLFLPESYGDFIFSIIGEEYGFIGVTIILAAFIFIFWRAIIIAKNAPDLFGYYLSCGVALIFSFYVLVNASVNTGLLPTTGLPTPFISYGGTAVIIYSAAIGVLLNISSHAGVYPKKEENFEDMK